MELDKEEVLNELMNFEKNYGRDCESGLPDCLERFLVNIAKSGDTIYPWNKIKPVILKKIELVVNEFNTKYPYENNPVLPNVKPFNFQEMKDEIIEKFDYFYGAPFTIQRICELLTDPSKYYKRSDKFMRGLEKNIRVISTIEARRADIENEPNSFQREFTRSPKNNNHSSPSSSASSSNILLSSPLPSSSTSSPSSSSAFMNGLNDKEDSPVLSITSRLSQSSCSPIQDQGPLPNSPAPLQQLDSFTTVFASPPSTPLAVVSDIHPYDAGSPSSSSSSSSDSSPQPSSSSSPPPALNLDGSEHNQSIDSDFDDPKIKDDDSNDKSEDSNEPSKLTDEPMDQTGDDKYEEAHEKLEPEELIKLETSATSESIKDDALLHDVVIKDKDKESTSEQCHMKESSLTKDTLNDGKDSEVTESISSLNESSPDKKQENVTKSSSIIHDHSLDKLIEAKDSKSKIESVEDSVISTGSTKSSGHNDKSDANDGDDIKLGGDVLNESNDSIKTESTESANTSIEGNLTPEKDKDHELDQDQEQEPTSSGSSTISEEETTDNSVTTSNQQSDIDEKPESH